MIFSETIFSEKLIWTFLPLSFTVSKKFFDLADALLEKWSKAKERKKVLLIPFLKIVKKLAEKWIWTLAIIISQKNLPLT